MAPGEQRDARRRSGGLLRVAVVVALTWTAAAVVVLLVAADTSAGPVVLTLSRRHGIHAGDVLALAACSVFAIGVTAMAVRRYRRAR